MPTTVAHRGPIHRRRTLAAGLAAALVLPFATISGASASGAELEVVEVIVPFPTTTGVVEAIVVHGIPDVDVDVLLDGTAVISDMSFTDAQVLDPAQGSYDIALVEPGTTNVVAGLEVTGQQLFNGTSYTIAAHLDADGDPTLSVLENETLLYGLEVFHLAEFAPVEVLADGAVAAGGPIANGQSLKLAKETTLFTDVGLALAGETEAAVEIGDIEVAPGGESPAETTAMLYVVGASDEEVTEPELPPLPALLTLALDLPTDTEGAQVVIVHAVPDLVVDVLVDGEAAVPGFRYGSTVVTTLDEGTYDLAVAAAGTTVPLLELEDVELADGDSVTVAAYLDADGEATLAAFENDTDATGVQAFHLAEFPAVALLSGTTTLADPLASGESVTLPVPGGDTVADVGIGLAGTTDAAIVVGDVTVPEDTLLLVLAVTPRELPFTDIEDSIHLDGILAVFDEDIVSGFTDGTFRPQDPIRRDQMATFLAKALELTPDAGDPTFTDTVGNTHEANIGAIAAAEVTLGVGDGRYAPQRNVPRGQMATFLANGFELEASATAPSFGDIAGTTHEDNIRAIAEARITGGIGGGDFGPDQIVTRGQMATFVARALGLIELAPES